MHPLSSPTSLTFQARLPQKQSDPQAIPRKLQAFQQGLIALQSWDQQFHETPILKKLDINALMKQVQSFLERQQRTSINQPTPFIIGLAGGTASGKTTAKDALLRLFPKAARDLTGWKKREQGPVIDSLMLDDYYQDRSRQKKAMGDAAFFQKINLDTPKALTLHQATRDVLRIKNGHGAKTPSYSFQDSSRKEGDKTKTPAPFFLVEGMFAFVPESLRKLMDLRVFIDTDYATRKARWWHRAPQRNIQPDKAGWAFFNRGMTMHDQHVEPTKRHADIILNGSAGIAEMKEALHGLTRLLVKTLYP